MSTHNICFCGEIRKILCGYPRLSVAMLNHPLHRFKNRSCQSMVKICAQVLINCLEE